MRERRRNSSSKRGTVRRPEDAVLTLQSDHEEARRRLEEIEAASAGVPEAAATLEKRSASAAKFLEAGRVAFNAGQHGESKELLMQALEAGAEEGECRRYLARICNAIGDWEEALKHWQWLREHGPEKVEPVLQVGRAQHRLGRYEEAATSLRAVLTLQSDHEEARRRLEEIEAVLFLPPNSIASVPRHKWTASSEDQPIPAAGRVPGNLNEHSLQMSSSLDQAILRVLSRPEQSELAMRVLGELVRGQRYENVAEVFEHCEVYYVLANNLTRVAQLAVAAGRPVTAFEYALQAWRRAPEDILARKILLDISERLNLWHFLALNPSLLAVSRSFMKLSNSLCRFVKSDAYQSEDQSQIGDASRYLFGALLKGFPIPKLDPLKRPNILIIGMHPGFGGAPGKAMRLATTMAEKKQNVSMLFESDKSERNEALIAALQDRKVALLFSKTDKDSLAKSHRQFKRLIEDVKIENIEGLMSLVRPMYKWRSIQGMSVEIDSIKPSIVHVIGTLDLQICAYFAARICGVPKILLNPGMMRSSVYAKTEVQLLESEFHRHVLKAIIDHDPTVTLVNNSQAASRDFEKWLNLDHGAIRTLSNGVSLNEDSGALPPETLKPKSAPRIGVIGRIAREKRPFLVADAIKILGERLVDFEVVFAGGGVLESELKRYFETLLPAREIKFLGSIDYVPALLKVLDCVLLVSEGEGLPNILIEAQAAGIPVISTDAGGSRETFVDGRTGVLVALNAKDIADGLYEVLQNPSYRKASEADSQMYRERFSMARMVEESLKLYGVLHTNHATLRAE